MHKPHPTTGILLVLSAVVCFALLDAATKYMTRTFPIPMLLWARFSVYFLLMLIFLGPSMRLKLIATKRPWEQIARSLVLVLSACSAIGGFKYLPLAEATAVIFVSPLLVLILARLFLRETVTVSRWLAAITGFFGVLLVIRPGGSVSGQGLFYLGISACCYAIYQIQTSRLSSSENILTLLFYTALVGSAIMTLTAPFYWGGPIPNTVQVLQIIAMGILGGVGHWLFIMAFRHAPASTLAPFTYAHLVLAMLFGWLFYDHLPDGLSIIGIAVIAASGISIALSEHFKRRSAPDMDTTR